MFEAKGNFILRCINAASLLCPYQKGLAVYKNIRRTYGESLFVHLFYDTKRLTGDVMNISNLEVIMAICCNFFL